MENMRVMRPGEQVRMHVEQEDANGRIMWELASTWYGFDNKNANNFSIGLLRGLADYAQTLNNVKNG